MPSYNANAWDLAYNLVALTCLGMLVAMFTSALSANVIKAALMAYGIFLTCLLLLQLTLLCFQNSSIYGFIEENNLINSVSVVFVFLPLTLLTAGFLLYRPFHNYRRHNITSGYVALQFMTGAVSVTLLITSVAFSWRFISWRFLY